MRNKSVNISIDDFESALKDITVNRAAYSSIFESPIFSAMKQLHDTYGAKFSCFCFRNNIFNISQTTTKFKEEFEQCAPWLKFSFHGNDANTHYHMVSLSVLNEDYEKTLQAIRDFAGEGSIGKVLRLHGYNASSEVMRELSARYGIMGVFAADDERISYDLTSEENRVLNDTHVLSKNNLLYMKTHIRYEFIPTVFELHNRLESLSDLSQLVLFTHESVFLKQLEKIEYSLKWLNEKQYQHVFFDEPNLYNMSV